jgi:TonB family protein
MPTAIAIFLLATVAACIPEAGAAAVDVPRDVQKWASHSPQPQYPARALARRATGSGIFVLRVRIKSGRVKAVDVARTTGDSDLDAAAVSALKQWRFRAGVLPPIKKILPHRKDPFATEDSLVKAPVTFTL